MRLVAARWPAAQGAVEQVAKRHHNEHQHQQDHRHCDELCRWLARIKVGPGGGLVDHSRFISLTSFSQRPCERSAMRGCGQQMLAAIAMLPNHDLVERSEDRSIGKDSVSTCSFRWSSEHYKNKTNS